MRKVKKTLAFHFGEGRSARAIATHCGIARRSVMQTLERFAASGPSWPEAAGMDDAALEAALYPARRARPADEGVDWAKVEEELSGRGAALKLLCRDATMRRNRRPAFSRRGRAQGAGVRRLDGGLGAGLRRGDSEPEHR